MLELSATPLYHRIRLPPLPHSDQTLDPSAMPYLERKTSCLKEQLVVVLNALHPPNEKFLHEKGKLSAVLKLRRHEGRGRSPPLRPHTL